MGNVAATRRQLQSILDGIGGLSAKLGMYYPEEVEGTSECFTVATVDVPVAIVRPARYESVENFQLPTAIFTIEITLFYAYANFVDFDYTQLDDLIEEIMHELCDLTNYDEALGSPPYEIEPLKKKGEHKADPRVIENEMKLTFKGVI